jgi:hypothetical protein
MLQRCSLILALALAPGYSIAQNITSPYSILGIGDIETKDYGKFFGMGSTSLAVRSASFINLNNPASLTALDPKMLNIDMNSRWRSSSFQYPISDSFTSSYNDAAIRRLSLTFRPGDKWGFSFGIKPYSTVNYQIEEKLNAGTGGLTNINKKVTGSGGINQVYLSNALSFGKHLSVGLTLSYLFGSLTRNTLYTQEDLNLNIIRNEYEVLKGIQLQGGLQYTVNTGEYMKHTIGLSVTAPTRMKGSLETGYTDNDTLLQSTGEDSKGFKLPLHLGIGYALEIDNAITIAADYNNYQWEKLKLDYPGAYLHQSQRFSLGFQYVTRKRMQGQMREKVFVQAGAAYEQGYIAIKGQQVNDLSATVGIGSNLTRLINVYLGLEIGSKGNTSLGQIRERYTQISAGVTLKEFWHNTRKMRLYD